MNTKKKFTPRLLHPATAQIKNNDIIFAQMKNYLVRHCEADGGH